LIRNEKWRRAARFLLRVLGSAIALILAFWFIEWESLWEAFRNVPVWPLLAAAGVWGIAFCTATLRWQVLLRATGIHLPLSILLGLNFSGFFYGRILPGVVSGDVIKAVRLAQKQSRLEEVVLSVAADRVAGLLVIGTFAVLGVFFAPEVMASFEVNRNVLIAIGVILVVGLAAGCFIVAYRSKLLHRYPAIRGRLDKIVGALAMYWRSPSSIVLSLLLSVVFQLAWTCIMWIIFSSFNITVPFVVLLWIVALVNAIMFLPISIGGLGVREGALVLLLGLYGAPPHRVMAASLTYFALGTIFALVGGVVEVVGNLRGWPLLAVDSTPESEGIRPRDV
jgi:uncharacterized protein (TIRG00374 family)